MLAKAKQIQGSKLIFDHCRDQKNWQNRDPKPTAVPIDLKKSKAVDCETQTAEEDYYSEISCQDQNNAFEKPQPKYKVPTPIVAKK